MKEMLTDVGYDAKYLDLSDFLFTNFTFSWHWDTTEQTLIVSLDTDDYRLIYPGIGVTRPAKTLYVTVWLSKRRMEILKRDAMAKSLKVNSVDLLDVDELIAPVSKAISGEVSEQNGDQAHPNGAGKQENPGQDVKDGKDGKDQEEADEGSQSESSTSNPDKPNLSNYKSPFKVMQPGDSFASRLKQLSEKQTLSEAKFQVPPPPAPKLGVPLENKENTDPKILKSSSAKVQQASFSDELMAAELDDIDLETLEKNRQKVKLNSREIVRVGQIGVATEEELNNPQSLGFSMHVLTEE